MAMNNPLIYFCHPCSRQHKYQIATYYCMNCGQKGAYICWQCKRHHEKFEELQTHRIQAIASNCYSFDGHNCSCTRLDLNFEENGHLTGERILQKENFCVFQEVQNLIDNYEKATAHLSALEDKRLAGMNKLKEDKNRIEDTIKEMRKNLNIQLDRLEKESSRELDIRYRKLEDKIKSEIEYIRNISYNWEKNMKGLMEIGGKSNEDVFKNIVKNGNILRKKSDALWEHTRNNAESEKLDFVPCQDIVNGKFDIKAFGMFVDYNIYEYYTSLQDEYDISMETDDHDIECDITGCCVMSDGTVILADHSNANLKKMNATYKIVATCNLAEPPCDLCPISDNEVAVTLPKKKTVQFVTIADELKPKDSLYVGYGCMCIDYSIDLQRLYVTYDWPMQIRVFNRDGVFLHAIWSTDKESSSQIEKEKKINADLKTDDMKLKTCTSGNSKRKLFCIPHKSKESKKEKGQIFSFLEDIMFSSNDCRLYICDLEKGLIVLTDSGRVISTVRNFREMPEFAPRRICRGCNNDFFVYGQSEKSKEFGILHVGNDKKIEKIKGDVFKMHDKSEIEAMCFNKHTSQLIITTKADNYIKVFNVF